jgi:intracellular sulfur oxidation DsrE/DsrF family protein
MPLSTRLARTIATLLLASLGGVAAGAPTPPAIAAAPAETPGAAKERAIFSVSDADPQKWSLTLGNIGNAIDGIGAANADVELVVYGPGIAMLRKDSPVAERIAAALKNGAHIVACQNSMRGFHLETADLAPGVDQVPSGVVELIRREHAGYAYVRS